MYFHYPNMTTNTVDGAALLWLRAKDQLSAAEELLARAQSEGLDMVRCAQLELEVEHLRRQVVRLYPAALADAQGHDAVAKGPGRPTRP
jgi:hypothetical protein